MLAFGKIVLQVDHVQWFMSIDRIERQKGLAEVSTITNQLCPTVEDIDYSKTKARSLWSNRICDRFHKTAHSSHTKPILEITLQYS